MGIYTGFVVEKNYLIPRMVLTFEKKNFAYDSYKVELVPPLTNTCY
jgi:hypothetical protein